MQEKAKSNVWKPSACQMCYNSCGVKAHVVNGIVVKLEGDPESPLGRGKLCALGNAGMLALYNPHRVTSPLKRTNPDKGIGVDPKWVEISWDEALDTITQKLKKIREEDPRKLAILSFDTDFIARLRGAWASAFGTINGLYGGATYFCGNGLHPVAFMTQGSFCVGSDLDYCNYLIYFGSQHGFQMGEDSTGEAQKMADARARGLKLVVIDPLCTSAGSKANEWLPIRPGTDAALALAMINVLVNEIGIYDAGFLKKYTNGPYLVGSDGHYLRDKTTKKVLIWDAVEGSAKAYDSPDIKGFALEGSYQVNGASGKPAFQLLKEHVSKYTPEGVAEITTIPAETTRRIAREFGEASSIGSKIVIEGTELPYRPACVYWRRGPTQHKHSLLTCFSIHLLNIIIGNIDVPGGIMSYASVVLPTGAANWGWAPKEGPDGMLMTGIRTTRGMNVGYPAREVRPPQSITFIELCPVSVYSEPMMLLNMTNPETFKLPYKIEALIQSRANSMMTTVNPKQVAEWLKSIPFIVSFTDTINETAEFADIVLPDARYLEKEDLFISNELEGAVTVGLGEWCYPMRQGVVEPPPNVRSWHEVIVELADRIGFRKDFYRMLNTLQDLKEPYSLDPDKKYSWEEIRDIWAKSWFGPEHDLKWFKEHGFIKWKRTIEEAYPRIFIKPRIPIYLEHFIKAGEDVKRVAQESGFGDWDVSDYQPFPDWKPCPAYKRKLPGYDLYVVPYRSQFHTFSNSADIAWIDELSEYHSSTYYILINSQTAKEKGLKEGELVRLETNTGEGVEGRLKITETIHPEVVGIAGCLGHWAKALSVAKGKGIHFNTLLTASLETTDMVTGAQDACVKVKIIRVS